MTTICLDNEISFLENRKKEGSLSFYESKKLEEYKKIKKLIETTIQ